MENIEVSIICTSYNYERYISQALDSFISQKTNFKYEIIVVDDCSTDNSVKIIKAYQEKHPELFKIFLNKKNKGLTQTWIDICQEAKGKYIARCDADDFWHDPEKLQKQYEVLENNEDSVWCNTDFNIVDEFGNVVHASVFKNGPIANANSFEKMLVTKGMTLPSSWMIDTKLMKEVNQLIDSESMDDGYPMQLEFFNRTRLVTLPEAMVSYRMTFNSDSRPTSKEKSLRRFESILKNQLDAIEKYPDHDYQLIAKMLVERDKDKDIEVYSRDREIESLIVQNNHLKTITDNQDKYIKELEDKEKLFEKQAEELKQITQSYNMVLNSRRWIIPTKIIDFFRRNK